MLKILDVIFLWAHLVVILFNLFGWIWKGTRKAHLIVLTVTLFSWLILGIKYGIGYCFLTDWHWEVKMKLGETNLPNSFVKYFFDQYTFLNISAEEADLLTIISVVFIILISVYLNFIKKIKKTPD
jgi:hypothetical protein